VQADAIFTTVSNLKVLVLRGTGSIGAAVVEALRL
jgi:hypothetical protein